MERFSLQSTERVETVQGYLSTGIGQFHHPRYGLASIEFGPKIGRVLCRGSLKYKT